MCMCFRGRIERGSLKSLGEMGSSWCLTASLLQCPGLRSHDPHGRHSPAPHLVRRGSWGPGRSPSTIWAEPPGLASPSPPLPPTSHSGGLSACPVKSTRDGKGAQKNPSPVIQGSWKAWGSPPLLGHGQGRAPQPGALVTQLLGPPVPGQLPAETRAPAVCGALSTASLASAGKLGSPRVSCLFGLGLQ